MSQGTGVEVGSLEFWAAREEGALARVRLLMSDKYGYPRADAEHIVAAQEADISDRIRDGRPVDLMIRSIEVSPSTLFPLPAPQLELAELKARADDQKTQEQARALDREP